MDENAGIRRHLRLLSLPVAVQVFGDIFLGLNVLIPQSRLFSKEMPKGA
jgi:hypothetical protein